MSSRTATKSKSKSSAKPLVSRPSATMASAPQRIIATDHDVAEGLAALCKACRYMRKAHDLAGAPPLRRRSGGFEGLARIIVGQQLSVASAAAIWTRVETGLGAVKPEAILARDDEGLRALGLSRPKFRTLRAASEAIVSGALPIDRLADIPEDTARALLTAVNGIGPWTADIYQMFCVGRADQFAPGDLALQIAMGMLMKRDKLTADELDQRALKWRPWRAVAARLLWHYYAVAKAQEKSADPV